MKQYKVEITKEALQDMEDIYNYIAIDLLASVYKGIHIKTTKNGLPTY